MATERHRLKRMQGDHPPGMVGVPMVRWMWTRAAMSLMYLTHHLPNGSELQVNRDSSTIAGKRNHLVKSCLEQDRFRWILFVDSDQAYPEDLAYRLLENDADIVVGVVPTSAPPHTICAGHEEGERSDDPLRPTDTDAWSSTPLDPFEVGQGTGTVEVDVAGTGCMLIRRHVLEAMDPPWFVANEAETEMYGQNEDFNFCIRAREAGFDIVCDTEVQCEHLGFHGVGVPDARRHRRATKKRRAAGIVAD